MHALHALLLFYRLVINIKRSGGGHVYRALFWHLAMPPEQDSRNSQIFVAGRFGFRTAKSEQPLILLAILMCYLARLDAFDQWCLRRILGITWQDHITNVEIRECTGLPAVSETISQRRLSMLSHMSRMPLSADAYKAIYQDIPSDWWRRPGRPRQSWLATIHRDLHYPLRRQRQMCIRDSFSAVAVTTTNEHH